MKKIILILLCIVSSIKLVNAATLVSEELPYYVKITRWDIEDQIIKVKKVYDKDNLNVVFNKNIDNYGMSDNFNIYSQYNYDIWRVHENLIGQLNTIIYYGYLDNPSDLNYFFTQLEIWNSIGNYSVEIVDSNGNKISDYDSEHINVRNQINNHITESSFFNKTYNYEIWTTNKFTYSYGVPILNNPIINGLSFKNVNNDLYIYSEKVGNYKLNFTKEYDQENYCYSDGENIYLQSLKGPRNISYSMNYNVYGTKLNIKENLIGVNKRFGDAKLNSKYELYLNDELKLTIDNFNDVYVKSNSNYILKDISDTKSINNIEDINFLVEDEEYNLVIDKYVISKNISLVINSDKTYYVYLKSNNELYETINSNIDLITLPYGLYYIKDQENIYYKEFSVNDNIDEELVIEDIMIKEENIIGKEDINIESEEIVKESNDKDDVFEEEIIQEEFNSSNFKELEVENPKTVDNIYIYILSFVMSILLILILKKILTYT